MKIQMKNPKETNEFYGKKNLLVLANTVTSEQSKTVLLNHIEAAFKECDTLNDLKLFYSILFSSFDVSNRDHNIFKGDIEKGGSGCRKNGFIIREWILQKSPKQYYAFLTNDVFRQYSNFGDLIASRVVTKKKTKNITEVLNLLALQDTSTLVSYVANICKKGSIVDKQSVAKWLTIPRTSKRKGGRKLQSTTIDIMQEKVAFYLELSKVMNWEVIKYPHNYMFVGLKEWKSKYNQMQEAVLFSSKAVLKMDEQTFINWLNEIPSGARNRVKRRLMDSNNTSKEKWPTKFTSWFLQWEKNKENAQKTQRLLEEKQRQGIISDSEIETLKIVKKEAKVNIGGINLFDELNKLNNSRISESEFNTITQSIMDNIEFKVPVLVIADCSASMGGLPTFVARFLATLFMLKNPSNDLDNILVTFGSNATLHTDNTKGSYSKNRLMMSDNVKVNRLIDRTKTFYDNYKTISTIVNSNQGSTNFSGIPEQFQKWVLSAQTETEKNSRIEQIQQYPVFLTISDGDLNNKYSAESSMNDFKSKMLNWFGWTGVVVVLNVENISSKIDYFANIENVIHYHGWNPSICNQIIANIHDLDIIDGYTQLKSMFLTNRYDVVRKHVLSNAR